MAHDVVVVGGGPGGYAVAFRAAARGLDVALIESAKVGGTCLHRGCIPSKAILHVAEVMDEVNRAATLGLDLTFNGLNGEALDRFRGDVVSQMHRGLEALVKQRCSALHEGRGRLVSAGVVEVTASDGSVSQVEGRNVVLATGSVPRSLPGIDIDGEVVLTSDQALWFLEAPQRAVIVGAGAIGMEFASMWHPFGAEVTVVEALDRALPLEDVDSSKAVQRAFKKKGIEVLTSAMVDKVAVGQTASGAEATVEVSLDGGSRSIEADVVLVAIGRAPNTADTGAAELGILDDRGFAVTDEYGRTSVDGVWAVGDVLPTLALAHAAFSEGFVVADVIAGERIQPVDYDLVPRVTYCHPEVASVGLTEEAARERFGDEVETTTYNLRANARAMIAGVDGHVKLVTRRGGETLGVHIVGPHATDLIAEATMATYWEALPAEVAAITHAHPTLYEAIGEAFLAASGTPFHGH
ncbi:MAG: dihydrolipoyl dehydrogenase [Actinobacteria bacterium]|nr:dihydrolipoyl dehydrogenase [Actinomycetota bacterium]